MGIFRFALGLLFILIIIMYSVQNLTPVTVGYYNHILELKTVSVPVIVVIFSSMFVGFIIAWIVNLPKICSLKSLAKKQRKEIKKMMKLSDKKDCQIASLTEASKAGSS